MPKLDRRQFVSSAAGVLGACAGRPTPRVRPRPNLLLLFPDQWRHDWLGSNPAVAVRTPHVDALAARGVLFERAVCASPLCAPSRACLAAGKEYDGCGVRGNGEDYPLDRPTFYRMLRASGYHVLGCGKFDLHKATEDWGLDGKRLLDEWGFTDGIDNAGKYDAIRSGAKEPRDPYMAYLHEHGLAEAHVADFAKRRGLEAFSNTAPTPLPDHAYCDNWIAERGLELLREAPADRPWFLQVNFAGPHDPLDATAKMLEGWRQVVGFPEANRNTQFPAAKHREIRQNYSALCTNIDAWVGRFLEEVERRGELDDTLVVFSSDHGEMLGDHNRWRKNVPYQPSVGVPLIVAGPGVERRGATKALASVMDLTATFLEAAGLSVPADMDSRSLMPFLRGESDSHRRTVRSGLDPWRMVIEGRWKLVRGFDFDDPSPESGSRAPRFGDTPPKTMLFDLDADPLENDNLAARRPDIVKQLAAVLRDRRAAALQ